MQKSHYETLAKVENYHWWFVAKRTLVTKFIPSGAKKVLDVGAGTGAYVKYLIDHNYQARGIEPSEFGLLYAAKSRLPVIFGTSHDIPAKDNEYDCVTCIDVLYHKNVDVTDSLNEMMRVLKPGGTLVVFDCAFEWLKGPHDQEVHARERFTKNILIKQIELAGGNIVYASYFYFLLFPIILLIRIYEKLSGIHRPIKTPSRLSNQILTTIMKFENVVIPYISYPWGSSIVVVAKK